MHAKFQLCLLLILVGTITVLGARPRSQKKDTMDVHSKRQWSEYYGEEFLYPPCGQGGFCVPYHNCYGSRFCREREQSFDCGPGNCCCLGWGSYGRGK